jgi:hypothetical protein
MRKFQFIALAPPAGTVFCESGTDSISVANVKRRDGYATPRESGEAPKYFYVRRMNQIESGHWIKYFGASPLRHNYA